MADRKVLIIAQTPPPFHGQAIMQKYLVDADWTWCEKRFIRMNFSEAIHEVGKLKIRKVTELFGLLNRIRKTSKDGIDITYYPPGGPNRIPIIRDIIILSFLRKRSKRVILHFHAGGIDQIFTKVGKAESYLIRRAFRRIDAVIVLSDWLKKEIEWCEPKRTFVVPNGIEDVFSKYTRTRKTSGVISFLFAGNLKKEKGIFTLLKAALVLRDAGEDFEIRFIGAFHDEGEKQFFLSFIVENKLERYVSLLGFKSGADKWREFESADVFCLPTYETEAMPVSIIEGMMFQMPVITTRWRSIPDMVKHQENGLLFNPDDSHELADSMRRMIHDDEGRWNMGVHARNTYLQNFTLQEHLNKMERVIKETLTYNTLQR